MRERRIWIAALGTIAALLLVLSGTPKPAHADILINNNVGATGTSHFTQSSATLLVFDDTVLGVFNDSGSSSGGANHFTGFSRSIDGGVTFTDMGTFPASTAGDSGFPVLARDNTSGTIYMGAVPSTNTGYQILRSVDGGATFGAAINATPGRTFVDVTSVAVDNFAGPTRGNVYVATRSFDSGNGIFLFRSTDGGATWGPNGGIPIASSTAQGPRLAVGPDHAVYVTWLDEAGATHRLQMKKSTDGGLTFAPPITVANLAFFSGPRGDLGLRGVRNGTTASAAFRSNTFPNIAVNPVTGHIYVVFADNPPNILDKADVFFTVSTDNGLTWAPRVRANDDLTASDQWMPTLAVTPDGSSLGIFWYDRRLDPDFNNNLIDYFGSICDTSAGAPTCGANFRISDVSFLPEFGRDGSQLIPTYMGDWDVAQADNSFFYVGWGDNRLPLSGGGSRMDPNVFFDKIAVPGVQAVPEPGTFLIVGLGVAALTALHKRRGRARPVRTPHA